MNNTNVAYCGLYCGACKKYINSRCEGCYNNEKANWCEIRKCCIEHNYNTCADCQMTSSRECKKYNNIFARVISFILRTDRSKCIERIKEIGMEQFAIEMKNARCRSIKK